MTSSKFVFRFLPRLANKKAKASLMLLLLWPVPFSVTARQPFEQEEFIKSCSLQMKTLVDYDLCTCKGEEKRLDYGTSAMD